MLEKDPQRRPQSMGDVEHELRGLVGSLRRRLGLANPLPPEETRLRFKEAVHRAKAFLDAGKESEARREARAALVLDPESEEAAELLWRSEKSVRARAQPRRPDPGSAARIEQLLARAAPGRSDDDAKRALAELALIAPDEPRLQDVLRQRAGKA
jgi:hypothetical protein